MSALPQRAFNFLAIFLLLFGAAWIVVSAPSPKHFEEAQPAPAAGFPAPDFTLDTMDGDSLTLSDLRGQAVLINLWASWCVPCRSEMLAMQRVYEDLRAEGFEILAVNATNQDSRTAAQAFVNEMGLSYPILMDVDGLVSRQYGLRALPTSFFVTPDGIIQDVVVGGPMAEALLRIRVEQLLEARP